VSPTSPTGFGREVFPRCSAYFLARGLPLVFALDPSDADLRCTVDFLAGPLPVATLACCEGDLL